MGHAGLTHWTGCAGIAGWLAAAGLLAAAPLAAQPEAEHAEAVIPRKDVEFLIRFGEKSPRPKAPGTIRLATYNLANLFDDIDDPALSGENEDIDDAKPRAERAALAETITLLDADILVMQEIESITALSAFRDEYLAHLGYEHVASIDAGDERGIEQAVFSRFPITSAENWPRKPLGGVHPEKWGTQPNHEAGKPILFHRSPLHVRIEVPRGDGSLAPYTLDLLAVHAKSGREGEYWREAEAKGVLEIVRELQGGNSGINLIVLGDFNSEVSGPSVKRYVDAGFSELFEGARTLPEITSHESGRRIDLMLLSAGVKPEVQVSSRFVLGTPARIDGQSWRDAPPPGWASDHYPVAVDLLPVEVGAKQGG